MRNGKSNWQSYLLFRFYKKKTNNNTNENSHVYLACLYIKEIVERHEQVVIIDSFRNTKTAVERGFS